MKNNKPSSNKQLQEPSKQDIRRGALFSVFTPIILMAIGIIYQQNWLIFIAGGIGFVVLYLLVGILIANRYGPALLVQCNPHRYYRYLRITRILFFFVHFNKSYYKVELALGLRNQGRFDKAQKILSFADVNQFATVEQKVVYYNNLGDLFILQNDYSRAQESLDAGFAVIEKLADESLQNIWTNNLVSNQKFLLMHSKNNTTDCEEFFMSNLEKAEREYSKIECHYNLGYYYFLTKQFDKSRIHFEYIIRHGNRLFHVKEAKSYLCRIKKHE